MERLLIILSIFILTACQGGRNSTNIEMIQDMMDQPALKAQSEGLRVPPKGVVPRNRNLYPYKDASVAATKLKNPFRSTPSVLEMGAKHYRVYCQVCHGKTGVGDGPVSSKMIVRPPSLLTTKVRRFKDGQIYHILTVGQGVMGGYGSQIVDPQKRWAIVTYIRSLQKSSK